MTLHNIIKIVQLTGSQVSRWQILLQSGDLRRDTTFVLDPDCEKSVTKQTVASITMNWRKAEIAEMTCCKPTATSFSIASNGRHAYRPARINVHRSSRMIR
jgi:hypothetical protein